MKEDIVLMTIVLSMFIIFVGLGVAVGARSERTRSTQTIAQLTARATLCEQEVERCAAHLQSLKEDCK